MNRVFHNLTVRTLDEDERVVEGWATTNAVDRMGDIVEPLGAQFDLPIPFLLDHEHDMAVGEVEAAEVTSKGIRFRARIKKIAEAGAAKELTDKAWHYLKYGLRKAVSIGFQPLEYEPLPGGGLRFTRWDWFELSAVTIPAQSEATITSVKRLGRVKLHGKVRSRREGVVTLDKSDKIRASIRRDADRRNAALKRLGLPGTPVKLDAADYVEAVLDAARQRRKRRPRSSKVSIR